MKKRLLSALLALALVFVLLPTTALAGVTTGDDYDISINGKGWKFERDNTSGAYIPAYYYHTNEFSADENYRNLYTNDNLMLTKKDNTVTITIRRGTSHDHRDYPIEFALKKESTNTNHDQMPCIEMGNSNNLVITGNGTLNIIRNEKDGIGAAVSSSVGDITITGGIVVSVTFKNQKNRNVSGNAISVDGHNLIISGQGTNVEAENACGNQIAPSGAATVRVENGGINVSGGAILKATNTYDDSKKPYDISYSRAISSTTLTIADENSSVIAWAYDGKYGKPLDVETYNITGAKIEVGASSPAQTITDINNIKNYKYAKISIPALQKTSDVHIAGGPAVVGQWTTITANSCSGSYYYDAAKKELTLKGITITRNNNNNINHAIQFTKNGDYTINLEGTNNISSVTNGICALNKAFYDDPANISVTISGSGSLNVTANTYAIDMQVGNLIFNSTGNITLTTNTNYLVQATVRNALHVAGKITIDNTKYDIVGKRQDAAETTETISDSSEFDPAYLNGYTVGGETTLFKTITITPAAAKDSTISYNRKTLKQGGIITGENGGTATVDSKNNTITLDNFKGNYPLEFNAEFTPNSITLIGDSTLSAVETKYQNLTISGSGSLTVGSIRVPNNTQNTANLTITGGAHVTVNRPSGEDEPAVEVSGNLTVTGDGTQLSAECTAATNPAIEVGGNVTISGNPGTNAYTVKAHNKYDTPRGRDDNLRPSQMPSAFEISGNLSISGSAQVMAQTDSDGAAVWMPKEKVISVVDASLIAQNRSHNFSTISFGDGSDMGNIYAKGQVNIVAENMLHSSSSLAHRAIKAHIYNHYSTGDSNPYYIKVVSEGVQSGGNVNVIPGHCTSTGGYKVTITRGDAYTTPQVAANYTIAGQTMYVGKYYKTNANGNITDGTAQDYNIYCDSANDFTLNNATISSTGTDVAINTNIRYETNVQHHIKLIGTNRINNTFKHAISAGSNSSTIIIEGVGNASDASLTINGNFLPIYSDGKVIINAEVVIVNTTDDNSFKGLISTSDGKGAFDLGSGYKCYASTSTTGTPLEEFNSANYSTYKYLRVTTQTLETGGGSTHQHVFSTTSWESNADYHWHKCTVQGCTEVSDKEEHVYTNTWWKNSNGNHGRTCDKCRHEGEIHEFRKYYDFVDATYHVERCSYPNCTYVGSNETHSYDSFGTCKCGYNPNGLPAPPSLQGVAPTSENGTDGKILNSNIGMEYAQNLNGPWTKWNEHSNITGLSAGTYYVRYTKTDERFPDNQVATVEVPAYTPGGNPTPDVPAAPTGLAGVAPTSANSKDGKITGTTAAMEYATSLEGDWTACANGSTDVPAGKYYVRMKKTDNTPAGEAVEVTVPAYSGTGEIVPPTPDNPGTIVIIRPAEEEKPAQQPNPSTGANDLVGLAVAAAVAAALGSAALLRKHD